MAQTGCTKPIHATQPQDKKQKKNDGQPPDTIKELVRPETGTKKNQVQQKLKFKAIVVKKNRVSLTLG
jgi:hypothetical protein